VLGTLSSMNWEQKIIAAQNKKASEMRPVLWSATIPRMKSDPIPPGVVADAHSIRQIFQHLCSTAPKTRIAKDVRHPATMFLVVTTTPLNTSYAGMTTASASIESMRDTVSARLAKRCYHTTSTTGHLFTLDIGRTPRFLCPRELPNSIGCV
jgi:hypothetical protein